MSNPIPKRLGVLDFTVGMRVRWRKGGETKDEILEVEKIEKRPRGKTVIHFKNSAGQIVTDWNAGNRYVHVDQK